MRREKFRRTLCFLVFILPLDDAAGTADTGKETGALLAVVTGGCPSGFLASGLHLLRGTLYGPRFIAHRAS